MCGRIDIRTNFRASWTFSQCGRDPINSISDAQFDRYLTIALLTIDQEWPNAGQEATLSIAADQSYVVLPDDFINNTNNRKILGQLQYGEIPGIPLPNYSGFSVNRNTNLLGNGNFNQYTEFANNISRGIPPVTFKPPQINITKRRIDNVQKIVWQLYPLQGWDFIPNTFLWPWMLGDIDIIYDAHHTVRNATALITVVTQPNVGDTIIVDHNNLDNSITFSFVASGATGNQINIGVSTTLTMANINAKLIALGINFSSVLSNNTATYTAPSGADFTITVDGTRLTNTYTGCLTTLLSDQEAALYKLIEAYALRGLTPQQILVSGIKLKTILDQANYLERQALNDLRVSVG